MQFTYTISGTIKDAAALFNAALANYAEENTDDPDAMHAENIEQFFGTPQAPKLDRCIVQLMAADVHFPWLSIEDDGAEVTADPSAGYTWRLAPHGSAWVLSNAEHADIGNAYLVPSGKWVGSPWGREIRHFEGPSAETDAKAWVEAAFR